LFVTLDDKSSKQQENADVTCLGPNFEQETEFDRHF